MTRSTRLAKTTVLTLLSLLACASTSSAQSLAASGEQAPAQAASQAPSAESAPVRGGPDMPQRMGEAMIAPLNDLNLTKAAIPPSLKAAQLAPYALPNDVSCPSLMEQVQVLDAALGADLDVPPTASNPSLLERGVGEVGNASVSALRSTTEGLLPFRGWVRKLTGAERHSRRVAAAITAGSIRRAYLKGLGQAKGCLSPASPRPPAP